MISVRLALWTRGEDVFIFKLQFKRLKIKNQALELIFAENTA